MSKLSVKGALAGLVEEEQFIVDSGNLYCVRATCTDCKYKKDCTIVEDSDFLESDYKKSTRNNIRFGAIKPKEWISVFPTTEALEHLTIDNAVTYAEDPDKVPEKVQKQLYLAQKDTLLYKRVTDKKVFSEDYVLFNEEDDSYYCLYKCDLCKHRETCKPEMIEKESFKSYVAIDSSAQEPQIITFLSEEPKYIEIFKNNSLYDIDYLLQPLEWIMEDVIGVDPKSDKGASFIDWIGFKDKTFLYELGAVMYSMIGNVEEDKLKDAVAPVLVKWDEFNSKDKG